MKKEISLILSFMLLCLDLCAQVSLQIPLNKHKKSDLNQYRIKVVDKRADTTAPLGKVKVDYRKGLEQLVAKASLSKDLEDYYAKLYPAEAGVQKELLALVYKFEAEEILPPLADEWGMFKYSADFFVSENDNSFCLLGAVDDTFLVTAYDVTPALLKKVAETIQIPYSKMVKNPPAIERNLNRKEFLSYQVQEKKYFKAYTTDSMPNGVYEHWNDFLALRKKQNRVVETENGGFLFYTQTEKRKKDFSNMAPYKIIVIDGQAYYKKGYNYIKMLRKGGDYYVTTKINPVVNKNADVIAYGSLYGLMGAFFAAGYLSPQGMTVAETYECKINCRTGNLIPIRKIDKIELKQLRKQKKQ